MAMVPTALVSRSLVEGCGHGAVSVLSMPFGVGRPLSTTGNLPSMQVHSGDTSGTTIVPPCIPQYPPLFVSRACDTIEARG